MKKRTFRWKSLLKGAAKLTGQLTKSGREFGLSESDARVSNEVPGEAFAVNLEVDMKRVFELGTREECFAYLTGKDDHGRPVKTMPVSQTSASVRLDFSRTGINMPFQEDLSLAHFVSHLCYALKEGIQGGQIVLNFPDFREIENFKLVRIVWMKNLSAWYPQFEDKEPTAS